MAQQQETRAADVAEKLGIDQHQARTYLSRLADSGRIQRWAAVCTQVLRLLQVLRIPMRTLHT